MSGLDRDDLPVVSVLLLAVVAVAVSAATIGSVVGGGPGNSTFGNIDIGTGPDPGGDGTPALPDGNGSGNVSASSIDLQFCVEFLTQPIAILVTVAALGLFFLGVYRRYNASMTLLVQTAVIPPVFASYVFLTNCPGGGGSGGGLGFGTGVVQNQGPGVSAPSIPPLLVAVAMLGVLVLVGAVLIRSTGGDEEYAPVEGEDIAEPEAADFARAAGRAADRIQRSHETVDNAVYRAWQEMTALLDIENPESSTPLDFAEVAIEFGLDEGLVSELTWLFNEVRYGRMAPNEREERAVEILRDLESEYGESSSGRNGIPDDDEPASGNDSVRNGGGT